jgi:hypothetical protein
MDGRKGVADSTISRIPGDHIFDIVSRTGDRKMFCCFSDARCARKCQPTIKTQPLRPTIRNTITLDNPGPFPGNSSSTLAVEVCQRPYRGSIQLPLPECDLRDFGGVLDSIPSGKETGCAHVQNIAVFF